MSRRERQDPTLLGTRGEERLDLDATERRYRGADDRYGVTVIGLLVASR